MNLTTKIAKRITINPWVNLIIAIASLAGIACALQEHFIAQTTSSQPLIIFLVALCLFAILFIANLFFFIENRRLKDIADRFREINSIYRDNLFNCFYGDLYITDSTKLMSIEKETITAVCQRISHIFSTIIGKDCVVTVKLLTNTGSKWSVNTYTRSENHSEREKTNPKEFEVNTGQNTALDQAIQPDTTGRLQHFYSADLRKHKNYTNQRPQYLKYYQSTLLVPIQSPGVESISDRDDIGFLCVDTRSRNRLNNGHHLNMLAALSDQMYNFMSLMRGKFTVNVGVS